MLDLTPLRDALPESVTLLVYHAEEAPIMRIPARVEGTPAQVTLVGPPIAASLTDPSRAVAALQTDIVLHHPAIVGPSHVGLTTDGALYYVSADPVGPTLRARIGSPEGVSATDVARLGVDVATALAIVHQMQLVHGLVRPESIAWDGGARAQLLDVGLVPALLAGGLPMTEIVRSLLAGPYAAPELLRDQSPDARSDVYALGVSLYELLTGRPPFGGRTTTTVLATVLADEPALFTTDGHQVPGQTVGALLRAIEKSPDDRWPSAAAFGNALAGGALEGTPAGVTAVDGATEPVTRAPRFGCLPIVAILILSAMQLLHRV